MAEVARIAGPAGYKLRRPFGAYDAVAFDTADRAAALAHWLREQRFFGANAGSGGAYPGRPCRLLSRNQVLSGSTSPGAAVLLVISQTVMTSSA
jgi:hypothetical protein